MNKIFIISAIRNLKKDKLHLFLNVIGLSLGLAAFLFITTYVFNEISFDRFNSKADRIYRAVAFAKIGDNESRFPKSEVPLAQAVLKDLPEVEEAARLIPRKNVLVSQNNIKFIEDEVWYADASVFNIFDFDLLTGNKADVLSEPFSVVLTQEAADKYFGSESPVGRSLEIGENKELYRVSGILGKIPSNSHLQFEILASFNSLAISRRQDMWGDFTATYNYLLVKDGTEIKSFTDKFINMTRKYMRPNMERSLGSTLEEWEKGGNYLRYELQPLTKIHLNNVFSEELKNHGNSRTLLIFGLTGIFILIIACFNFINLSTAKDALRAKEIGVKKVIGSSREEIVIQILTETFLLSITALAISIVIVILSIPLINDFSGIEIQYTHLLNRITLLTIIIIPVVITLLAGSYPAFYITRFKPHEVIKGKISSGRTKSYSRGWLVTLQFTLFIILIFSSIIIRNQLLLMQSKDPGFNKENVLVIKRMSRLNNSQVAYKEALLENPKILNASFASKLPSVDDDITNLFCEKGKPDQILMARLYVDDDFDETLNIQMIDGRFFTEESASEARNAVINEEAARLLGWSDSDGKVLYDYNNGGREFNVIGIVKDFHLRSMRDYPSPLVIRITERDDYLALQFTEGEIRNIIDQAKSKWDTFNNGAPFEYFLLDENYDTQYKREEQLSKLTGIFTIIAIVIACMGLFGLVSFTSSQKRKEIGIRKVNGAEVPEIIIMLNKDFIKWIIIAFIIAVPVAWFAMHHWLLKFAYKTELSWWIFALAGLLALGIALLTVSWQSWRAATRNPVEALRYE